MDLRSFLISYGFTNARSDTSLFVYHHGESHLFLLVYVDNIIFTGNSVFDVRSLITTLANRFSLKDLGNLHYFLGVEVTPYNGGLLITQHKYISDVLECHHMLNAKGVSTPMYSSEVLTANDGLAPTDATEYRCAIGALQYLSFTRPDICFAVNKLAQFMHCPTTKHWQAVKRLLRYLKNTITYGLHIKLSTSLSLTAFSDADWAGNHDDRMSTSAYIIFLGSTPISWSAKK